MTAIAPPRSWRGRYCAVEEWTYVEVGVLSGSLGQVCGYPTVMFLLDGTPVCERHGFGVDPPPTVR